VTAVRSPAVTTYAAGPITDPCTCKQIQPLSRIKTLNGPRVRRISAVRKEKVYGGNDLPRSQVLSSEWNTERVREDASGDSEDGDDDELPCVIAESAGDWVWRGSQKTTYEIVSESPEFYRKYKTTFRSLFLRTPCRRKKHLGTSYFNAC